MLQPQACAFLDRLAAMNRPPIETVPIPEARALFEQLFIAMGGPGVDVAAVRDFDVPGPRGPIPVRAYTPEGGSAPRPLFVYFHGGGWTCGSRNSYDSVCRLLARESECVVASVEYRLAPEHPAPEGFEDAYAAFTWLAANAGELRANGERIAIGGDSAGGGLAASVALKARDENGPRIAHQMLVYPAVSNNETSPSFQAYGEGHFLTMERILFYDRCYIQRPEVALDPYVKAENAQTLRGLPPATIILAECDPLYDMGVAYAERLRADGVPVDVKIYPGMIHAFFSFVGTFDDGRDAVTYAGRAVGNALGALPAAH
ncbi:MAG TPA: alpha/beta hydrolase [Candidatus Elarobacter sp.]|jgi:acetyl esterase|nr:alpha/beta hydrolase [Candidatus Elarobacter sp.]